MLVTLVLVDLFCCLVTVQGGGVTTYKVVRIVPLFLLHLPIPTRTRNEGVRLLGGTVGICFLFFSVLSVLFFAGLFDIRMMAFW